MLNIYTYLHYYDILQHNLLKNTNKTAKYPKKTKFKKIKFKIIFTILTLKPTKR